MLTNEQFNKACKALKTAQAKSDDTIHKLGCVAIYYSVKDRNADPAIRLIASLGRSARRNDLISWMIHMGNLIFSDKKGLVFADKRHKPEDAQAIYDNAEANPFWTIVAERKPIEIAFSRKRLLQIIKRIDNQVQHGARVDDPELLSKVRELAQQAA